MLVVVEKRDKKNMGLLLDYGSHCKVHEQVTSSIEDQGQVYF